MLSSEGSAAENADSADVLFAGHKESPPIFVHIIAQNLLYIFRQKLAYYFWRAF
jgi:hypothetical protein